MIYDYVIYQSVSTKLAFHNRGPRPQTVTYKHRTARTNTTAYSLVSTSLRIAEALVNTFFGKPQITHLGP